MSEGTPHLGTVLEAVPRIDVSRAAARPRARGELLVAAILIAGMWVATRPYYGIIHDARLYSVQALNALYRGRFSADLYFKYGSQDSFSLYTPVYKLVVAALGLRMANFAATITGEGLWLVSAAWLARTLFKDRTEFLAALAATILLYSGYGGLHIFHYAEPFATPRLFAEGLTLLSFALAVKRRFLLSTLAITAAALLHPLIALGGLAVMALVAAFHDRRVWLLIAVGGCAAIILTATRVGPFARAFASFDDAWFQVVRHRCNFALVSEWQWPDYCQIGASFSALCVAHRLASPFEKTLILSTLIASVCAIIVSVVGADLFHNVLVVNLQVWRVLWLASLAANAFLAIVILRAPAGRVSLEYLAAAIVLAIGASFFPELSFIAPFVLLAALAILQAELQKGSRFGTLVKGLVGAAFVLAMMGAAWLVDFNANHSLHFGAEAARAAVALCSALLLIALVRWGATRLLALVASASLLASLTFADEIEPWDAFTVSDGTPASLRAFVPAAGTVYWEGEANLDLLWFKLLRPGYYSCLQGTGAMFYRGTAMDYARRGAVLRALNTRDFKDLPGEMCESKLNFGARGPTSRIQLTSACRALPDLDTVILDRAIPGVAARSWRAPVAERYRENDGSTTEVSTFYRYSCADLR
ncbi:MAG: hypothetical protein ACREEB_02135 [Caulobacteraceae bacterium]